MIEKERAPGGRPGSPLLLHRDHQIPGPRLPHAVELHRRDDVHQHPGLEEVTDVLSRCARGLGHERCKPLETIADDGSDVGVVARDVRLELQQEPGAVLEQARVRSAHRVQGFLAGAALGRPLERVNNVRDEIERLQKDMLEQF